MVSKKEARRKDLLLSLIKRLKLKPSDPLLTLLDAATTHPSVKSTHSRERDYERLEFLGDSVLGLAIADLLFHANPNSSEGDLSAMKSSATKKKSLAEFGKYIGIDNDQESVTISEARLSPCLTISR